MKMVTKSGGWMVTFIEQTDLLLNLQMATEIGTCTTNFTAKMVPLLTI